jgi:uncharacterized lipoprotein YbaY
LSAFFSFRKFTMPFIKTSRLTRWTLIAVSSLLLTATLSTPSMSQTRWDTNPDERNRSLTQNLSASSWLGGDWLGTANQQVRRWRLGVTGDNRQTGVLVRQVSAGSAAARARIEAGDLIVNVGGFQVGMVEGRLYDLAEEINRRADANGQVTLVVQDRTSGQLAVVPIQLDNHDARLTGILSYRERGPLPTDAIVTVQVENLTRPHFAVRNGTTQFRPLPGASIPFEIAYDPSYINQQDTYQVRATVTSAGRTILETQQPQRVLTGGAPSQVQLVLIPVTGFGTGGVVTAGYPNYNAIDDRLTAMYRKYLNRDPLPLELASLRLTPGIDTRLETLPLDIMAGQEYFDAAGNNNLVWLERVFSQIVKRPPTQDEMLQWMQRYAELGNSRTDLLRQLYSVVRR